MKKKYENLKSIFDKIKTYRKRYSMMSKHNRKKGISAKYNSRL